MNNHRTELDERESTMAKLHSGATLMRQNLARFIGYAHRLERPALVELYIRMEALNAAIRAELDIMEEEAANGHR